MVIFSFVQVRLVIDQDGQPRAESFALSEMPDCERPRRKQRTLEISTRGSELSVFVCTVADPVRLVLNTEPTEYDSPFMRFKTSRRAVYDSARATLGEHSRSLSSTGSCRPPPASPCLLHNESSF